MQQQAATPTTQGPAEGFTGDVHVDMVVTHPDARFSVAAVHFTPMSGMVELAEGQEAVTWREHVDDADYDSAIVALRAPHHPDS